VIEVIDGNNEKHIYIYHLLTVQWKKEMNAKLIVFSNVTQIKMAE